MTYEYYGYPPDWLDRYQAEIKKVAAADVNRVAAKYLHRDQLAVLVVINIKAIRQAFVVSRRGERNRHHYSGSARRKS